MLGWSLPQIPKGLGFPQALCAMWGPQWNSWRNWPLQPQGKQKECWLHSTRAIRFWGIAAGCATSWQFLALLPQHSLCLHLLDLHDECSVQKRWLTPWLLLGVSFSVTCTVWQQDPFQGPEQWLLSRHLIPSTVTPSPNHFEPPKLALKCLCSLENSALYFLSKNMNPL